MPPADRLPSDQENPPRDCTNAHAISVSASLDLSRFFQASF